jgi:mannose-6-phosphate isomerase-like protein (cupin superfamily)
MTLQLDDGENIIQHLFVLEGQVRISDDSHHETVNSGASFTRVAADQISIENASDKEICLIQIRLDLKAEDFKK